MGILGVTEAERLRRLEAVTSDLIRAMWELHTDFEGRAASTLSLDAMNLIRSAADAAGVDLP